MNFDLAFERLIGHEGAWVNDPRDPGGETKYGISRRSYPGEMIRTMTLERAKEIYLRDYWGPAGCNAVPDAIKYDLFDMAVHSGVITAIKTLQRTVNVDDDGKLGPVTLQAVASMPALEGALVVVLGLEAVGYEVVADEPFRIAIEEATGERVAALRCLGE